MYVCNYALRTTHEVIMSIHLKGAGGAPGMALARFATAQLSAAAALNALAERLHAEGHSEEAGIFEAQALMAEDPYLSDEVARRVRDQGQPLIGAIAATIGQMRAELEALDDEYLRARAADMDAIGQSILGALHGQSGALRDLPA